MECLAEEDYEEDEPEKQVVKLPETAEMQGNLTVGFNRILALTSCLSKWKLAHSRGYHSSHLGQDPAYQQLFQHHELDLKTNVPLALVCMNEKEILQILMNTEEDYCKILGAQHILTLDVRERIELLRVRVVGKNLTPLKENQNRGGAWASLYSWINQLFSLLRGGAVEPEEHHSI